MLRNTTLPDVGNFKLFSFVTFTRDKSSLKVTRIVQFVKHTRAFKDYYFKIIKYCKCIKYFVNENIPGLFDFLFFKDFSLKFLIYCCKCK